MRYSQYNLTKGVALLAMLIAGSFEVGNMCVKKTIEAHQNLLESYKPKPMLQNKPTPQIDEVSFYCMSLPITRNYIYGCFTVISIVTMALVIYVILKL